MSRMSCLSRKQDFYEDLKTLFQKTGIELEPTVFWNSVLRSS